MLHQAAEAAQAMKVIQQMAAVQCSSEKESIVPITPLLACAVGVDVDTRQSPPVRTPNKRFFNYSVQTQARIHQKNMLHTNIQQSHLVFLMMKSNAALDFEPRVKCYGIFFSFAMVT
jgi:hypothetical protein